MLMVEPHRLQIEWRNKGHGFQLYGKYFLPTHRSRGTVSANTLSLVAYGSRHNS